MHVPVEELIDGVVDTLIEAVLPEVGTRPARAQLYAAVDVLRNLRDRIEEKAALLDAEAESAERALAVLPPDVVRRIETALAAVPAGPVAERVAALRAVVVAALEAVPAGVNPARVALEAHLTAQAMRDVAVLKPSLIGEISKG